MVAQAKKEEDRQKMPTPSYEFGVLIGEMVCNMAELAACIVEEKIEKVKEAAARLHHQFYVNAKAAVAASKKLGVRLTWKETSDMMVQQVQIVLDYLKANEARIPASDTPPVDESLVAKAKDAFDLIQRNPHLCVGDRRANLFQVQVGLEVHAFRMIGQGNFQFEVWSSRGIQRVTALPADIASQCLEFLRSY